MSASERESDVERTIDFGVDIVSASERESETETDLDLVVDTAGSVSDNESDVE